MSYAIEKPEKAEADREGLFDLAARDPYLADLELRRRQVAISAIEAKAARGRAFWTTVGLVAIPIAGFLGIRGLGNVLGRVR